MSKKDINPGKTVQNKTDSNYFLLLQINDAVFPIGAYTHSYGLETYIQKNLVHDRKSAFEYIKANLRGTFLYTELLAVRFAYEYSKKNKLKNIQKLDAYLRASKAAKETRNASEMLGSRFVKAVLPTMPAFESDVFNKYVEILKTEQLPTNYAVIYGVFCASTGIDLDKALRNYIFSNTSATMTNCVKTVPLSQNDGQKILSDCYNVFNEVVEKVYELKESDIGRAMPGFEIRSMQHEHLYSRLYIS